MDELTMIRELDQGTPLPDAARLAPARARLMAAAGEPRTRWSRKMLAGLTTAGLAAAAAAAIALLQLPGVQIVDPAPESTRTEPGSAPAMVPVAQVLDQAAVAALATPSVVPRPDQFLYLKQLNNAGAVIYEGWFSIDGKHDGLVDLHQTGGRHPVEACDADGPKQDDGGPCVPDPRYLPNLPTEVDGMIRYFEQRNDNDYAEAITNGIAKDMWHHAEAYWLTSAQRAALYRAAAKIPGLRTEANVTDAAGRKGTGVTWSFGGGSAMWIFDPQTHLMLGSPEATSTTAIVDRAGDRP